MSSTVGSSIGRVVALLLLTVALSSLQPPAPAVASGTTTFRGAFSCSADGQPLAGARVELWEIWSTDLPKLWPNARLRSAVQADVNGGWGFRVSGDETNWFVRVVLTSENAEVGDWLVPWSWFADTAPNQNDVALHDYGVKAVPGEQCALWNALQSAHQRYRNATGSRAPMGEMVAQYGAPTAGVPFTPYDETWWPSGYPIGTTPEHEFAHAFRHTFDGPYSHFVNDVTYFFYLQQHSATSCSPTNSGFAFNEGFAEYWQGEVRTRCPENPDDYRVERNVAAALRFLQDSCHLSRGEMVAVLATHPGTVHSYQEFSNLVGCLGPLPVPGPPKVYPIAWRRIVKSTVADWTKTLRLMDDQLVSLVQERQKAQQAIDSPLPCQSRPCPEEYQRLAEPWIVKSQIVFLQGLRDALAGVAQKRVVRPLVKKGPVGFATHWAHVRDEATATGRQQGARVLRLAVAAVEDAPGGASDVRQRVLDTVKALQSGVRSGEVGALTANTWVRVGGLERTGPSPDGIVEVSGDSGQPVQASVTSRPFCHTTAPGTKWFPEKEGQPNYPGPPPVTGTVTPAVAGTVVRVEYTHATSSGTPETIRAEVTTDASGHFSHGITQAQWGAGYGRTWQVTARFDGDAGRYASASPTCLYDATFP